MVGLSDDSHRGLSRPLVNPATRSPYTDSANVSAPPTLIVQETATRNTTRRKKSVPMRQRLLLGALWAAARRLQLMTHWALALCIQLRSV